jgi:sigma-B regulation protein RsbU (phosphoserine phosphatase)
MNQEIHTLSKRSRQKAGDENISTQSHVEHLELLLSIAQDINSILDLDQLLKHVASLVKQVIPYHHFAIFLYDPDKLELSWEFGIGYSEEARQRLERFPTSRGLVGRAVRTRSSVISLDVSMEPDFLFAETDSGESIRSALAIPLIHKDRVVGVMTVESTRLAAFTEDQEQLLSALAGLLAIGLDNARLYRASVRDAATRELLFEVSKETSSILDLHLLLDKIADMLTRVINYDLFAIFLLDPLSGDLVLRNTRGWSAESIRRYSRITKGTGLYWKAIRERRSFITEDTSVQPSYLPKETSDGRRLGSQINIPLLTKDRPVGVMSLEGHENCCIDAEHEKVLNALANQMAIAIENAQLYEEILTREKKLESDTELAREVQRSMLPDEAPVVPGFELASSYLPADNIGGDFYDYLRLPEGRTGIVIADVSGKGVAAAMIMAASRGAVRSAAQHQTDPAALLHAANRRLYRDIKRNVYITACYGVLDPAQGIFSYSSAGHFPPILVRENGEHSYLEAGGTILGMFDGVGYEEETLTMASGDLICFYTDGIVEAFNKNDEPFGEERLEKLLKRTRHHPASEIMRLIISSVQEFASGREQHDDMTVIVLKAV